MEKEWWDTINTWIHRRRRRCRHRPRHEVFAALLTLCIAKVLSL